MIANDLAADTITAFVLASAGALGVILLAIGAVAITARWSNRDQD